MIYLLSCETIENGGGVYGYHLTEKGSLEKRAYFACDRPMYAVKCKEGLCVLLRAPFGDSDESGYFFLSNDLKTASPTINARGVVACHLFVDENVYIVNYLSGNVVKNGQVVAKRSGNSLHPKRQTEPHTHFVTKTKDGYLVVCDLGTDKLAIYDTDLRLVSEESVKGGYGIRHLVFSKDGKYIYAVNELIPSVSVFSYQKGVAKLIATKDIVCKNPKANGAAIRISDDGKRLFVSLREENVICEFKVDGERIELIKTFGCGGDSPRDFDIFGENLIVCNERDGKVAVIKKDGDNEIVSALSLPAVLCCL